MNAVVQPILTPDSDSMRSHVEHLFGGYLDGCHEGLIELSWTDTKPDTSGRYRLANARLFGTDKLDDLVDEAARLNSNPMCNVYIGAALRHPDTPPFGRGQDRDAWALTCAYVDLDDAEAATNAKHIYGQDKPTLVVVTGRAPHTRAQMWWRLEEPLTDSSHWPALLRGMATKMNADTSVTNPSRVMRLAGSIAWPVKPGRSIELTSIAPLNEPGAAEYSFGHLARVFPPAAGAAPVAAPGHVNHTTNSLGLADKINDGREAYMRSTIAACLIELIGSTGCCPTPQELYETAWPQYERKVDLSRAGRGPEEFAEKCAYAITRFERGDIRGIETLDKAVERYEMKEARPKEVTFEQAAEKAEEQAKTEPGAALFEYLSVSQIKTMPDPKWLVSGLVIEQALGFIYGPPGCLKTFIALGMALSFATGRTDWWGRTIERQGAVVYISSEGQSDLKFRIKAWEQHNNVNADDSPFFLIRQTINFMKAEDVGKLVATVQAIATLTGQKIAAVFVDTVSRVLPGADENLQKDMTLFVAACDAVRQRFDATVIGVHHTSRGGNMRGSTVFPGAGDFLVEVNREEGAKHGSIRAAKIKAAEDGWEQHFKVEEITINDIRGSKSLVVCASDEKIEDERTPDKWPSADVCKVILSDIRTAWFAGKPWSTSSNTANEGRYANRLLVLNYGVTQKTADQIIERWLTSQPPVLAVEVFSAKAKLKGLKVVGGIC
jgi:hypothetical protein